MVVSVSVDMRVVARLGRSYQWPACAACPRCNGKTWGHGWVPRIFAEAPDLVMVPRRRCPRCRTVITLRPESHRPRLQTATARILEVVRHRLAQRVWPLPALRQRFGHWLCRFHVWLRMTAPGLSPLAVLLDEGDDRWLG